MDEFEIDLIRCFASVFPSMTEDDIRTSDVSQLLTVDSLAAVTLVALIDEQFGVSLDLDDLLKLENFSGIRDHLYQHSRASSKSKESAIR